ncbi:MAG: sporulation protein YabP [Firmicutes bacterium]|nr:sporulation protein YabP [Bacillota bacterium]
MQNDNVLIGNHEVKMTDRKTIFLTGIKKIVSFDNEEFLMESNMGVILLKGENLELIKLDTADGNVKIKGKINNLNYVEGKENKKQESLITKLFK